MVEHVSKDFNSVRISRLFNLIALLSRPILREEIISRLGYTGKRTLERDLKFLRDEFGVQIKFSRLHGTYSMESATNFLVYLKLTRDEVSAVSTGLSIASHFLPHLKEASDSAWEKFSACVPEALLERGRILAKSTTVSLPVPNIDPATFECILDAIHDKKTLNLNYKSPLRTRSKKYIVSPWSLCFRAHAWYVSLFDHGTKESRSFRLTRIRGIAPANELYVAPKDGEDETDASCVWYVEAGKPKYDVRVRIAKELAMPVSETKWHSTQRIIKNKDGSIDFCAKVPKLEEVAWWVLASSPCATVIEPEELRQIVCDLAAKVMENHKV